MWWRILRWLSCLFLAGVLSISLAQAQAPPLQYPTGPDISPDTVEHSVAGEYALAALGTILVMVILCVPSRKAASG